jgi:hypothetical protein
MSIITKRTRTGANTTVEAFERVVLLCKWIGIERMKCFTRNMQHEDLGIDFMVDYLLQVKLVFVH